MPNRIATRDRITDRAPRPGMRTRGAPPSMADLVVRAMRRPKDYWGDLTGVVETLFDDGLVDSVREQLGKTMSRRDKRLLAEAMGERMARFSKGERGRIAGCVEGARRFVLDDSFIAAVFPSTLGRDRERLAETIQLARLPFESVFVEMSRGDIMRAASLHDGADEPDAADDDARFGMLVERVRPEDPTTWTATLFRARGGSVTIVPFVSVVQTEGLPLAPLPPPFAPVPDGLLPHDAPYVPLGVAERAPGGVEFMVPSGYEDSFGLAYAPLYHAALGSTVDMLRETGKVPGLGPGGPDRGMMQTLSSERGLLRFVLGVLATVNALPHALVPVEGRDAKGADGRALRLLPYETVTLRLGGPDPGAFDREIEAAAAREAHKVRGHWRTYRNPDGTPRKRVWVREHVRGEGEVREKDYAVTVAKGMPVPPMPWEPPATVNPPDEEGDGPDNPAREEDAGFFGRLRGMVGL